MTFRSEKHVIIDIEHFIKILDADIEDFFILKKIEWYLFFQPLKGINRKWGTE